MTTTQASIATISLPAPMRSGGLSLSEALTKRRSIREFTGEGLSTDQIAQLCWASLGITDKTRGLRTAPSAGTVYPMRLFLADADGVYEYRAQDHSLEQHARGDKRLVLQSAAAEQLCVGTAPVCFVIVFDETLMRAEYGTRGAAYCLLEAGHIAQNVLLQAAALGLDAVPVGAFDDGRVSRVLSLPAELRPAYLVPIGYPVPTGP